MEKASSRNNNKVPGMFLLHSVQCFEYSSCVFRHYFIIPFVTNTNASYVCSCIYYLAKILSDITGNSNCPNCKLSHS